MLLIMHPCDVNGCAPVLLCMRTLSPLPYTTVNSSSVHCVHTAMLLGCYVLLQTSLYDLMFTCLSALRTNCREAHQNVHLARMPGCSISECKTEISDRCSSQR